MLEHFSTIVGHLKKFWKKLQNSISGNKGHTFNNTKMNGFQNNSGIINVHNVSGAQTNNYYPRTENSYNLDPIYKCYFYKGKRVCADCFPDNKSELTNGNLGSIPHFRCNTCGRIYHQES